MTSPSHDFSARVKPPPPLPLELLDRIIFFASLLSPHDDSTQTLSSLCLTSHDLHTLTTPYLYRDPLLSSISQQRAFWSTIAANPHLWWHVRNITLGQRDWRRDAKTTFRPRPRLVQLGEGIGAAAAAAAAASTGNSRWAENFHLWTNQTEAPSLHRGGGCTGPEPTLLEEVAWWEEAPVGGLLSGHSYGTKPVGEWSKPVDLLRREMQQRQERARTVEDVDLGRGPGQSLGIPVREEDREDDDHQSARTPAGADIGTDRNNTKPFQTSSLQPSALNDDDLWAAAERFAAMSSSTVTSSPAAKTSAAASASAQSHLPSSSIPTPTSWPPIPSSLHAPPTRIPYRYTLITGYLDPNLPRFFHSIPSLQQIQLTLYPGTLLDHDLLEHQLRLLLDTDLMPILQRLDVVVAHDCTSIGTRLARITHSKVIELAVSRVDDPRCVLNFDTSTTTYGGVGKDSRKDVRDQVAITWMRGMRGELDTHIDLQKTTPVKGKKWINAWLQRDHLNLNRPVEE